MFEGRVAGCLCLRPWGADCVTRRWPLVKKMFKKPASSRSNLKQRGDRLAIADAADGLTHQWGDAHDADFFPCGLGHGVGGDDFLNLGFIKPPMAKLAQNRVRNPGKDPQRPVLAQNLRRRFERAGRLRHVINQ